MTLSTTARRLAAVLVVPLLAAPLAACGDDGAGPGAVPHVSAEDGKKPSIDKGEGDPPEDLKVEVLKKGKGRKVHKADFVTAHYAGQTWKGKAFDNSYERKKPSGFRIGVGAVVEGWDKGLVGQPVGSRVELVIPPEMGYGDNPREGSGIEKGDTLVFVVEITDAVPMNPDGEKIPQKDENLPQVGTNTDGKAPEVTLPDGQDAPGELVDRTIIEGSGEKVGAKDTVLANYKIVEWKNPKARLDTWTGNPPQMPPNPQELPVDRMPGWKKGLVGHTVGSRVLIVVPKSEFPEKDRKKASDVVMVVDIMKTK